MILQRDLQQSENCAKKVDGTFAIFYISKGFFFIDSKGHLQPFRSSSKACEHVSNFLKTKIMNGTPHDLMDFMDEGHGTVASH